MSNWETYVLNELAHYHNGIAFKPIHWGKTGLPIVRIEQLNNPEGDYDFFDGEIPDQNLIHKGDIVFSWSATLKVVIWTRGNAALNQHLFKVVPKKGFDKCFVYYVLDYNMVSLGELSHGSTMKHIKRGDLDTYKVNCPSDLPEQRKIARILTTVDAGIEKTEAAIAKYEAIKKGMMADLFTRGIDAATGKLRPRYEDAPELYKETELGWVPKDWDVEPLEEVADFVDYRGKTPPKSEFGIFLVTARNIKDDVIDYEISKEYIPEYAYEMAMSRGRVNIGDVLITTEAPMGNVAQIDREYIALAQRIIKYRGKQNRLINDYLAINLRSSYFQRQLVSEATGSTVLGIKGSRLHKISISIPKRNEQILISNVIKQHEVLLKTEKAQLLKLKNLKQGLMADLLTGRVRVQVAEEVAEKLAEVANG